MSHIDMYLICIVKGEWPWKTCSSITHEILRLTDNSMSKSGKAANIKILRLRIYLTSWEDYLYILYHSYQSQENQQEGKRRLIVWISWCLTLSTKFFFFKLGEYVNVGIHAQQCVNWHFLQFCFFLFCFVPKFTEGTLIQWYILDAKHL